MTSQVQPVNIYKAGIKQGVAFTSLKDLEKYEPEIFALFSQPFKDGQRVETTTHSYRLRDSGHRFGISVTRWTKTKDKDKDAREKEKEKENLVFNSGSEVRNELNSFQKEADTKALASLHEIRKQVNTILVAIDILVSRLERQ